MSTESKKILWRQYLDLRHRFPYTIGVLDYINTNKGLHLLSDSIRCKKDAIYCIFSHNENVIEINKLRLAEKKEGYIPVPPLYRFLILDSDRMDVADVTLSSLKKMRHIYLFGIEHAVDIYEFL